MTAMLAYYIESIVQNTTQNGQRDADSAELSARKPKAPQFYMVRSLNLVSTEIKARRRFHVEEVTKIEQPGRVRPARLAARQRFPRSYVGAVQTQLNAPTEIVKSSGVRFSAPSFSADLSPR